MADAQYLARAARLARIYVDALLRADGTVGDPDNEYHLLWEGGTDIIANAEEDTEPWLGPDLILAAVLTAKAIATRGSLAVQLRRGTGVAVTIETWCQELVGLVETVISTVATPTDRSKHVVARDGTDRSDKPDSGNGSVRHALAKGASIIGIATDCVRYLPELLTRGVDVRLSLDRVDDWAFRIFAEALTGQAWSGSVDPKILSACSIDDFGLAFKRGQPLDAGLAMLGKIARERAEKTHTTGPRLEDLIGYGEAATWGLDLIADIADYRAGRLAWEEIDNRSILLSGPPGTGKTTFAAALARSAGMHLVATSVADWNAFTYMSGTLQAMKGAFAEAKKNAPSVLMVDELDGIGRRDSMSGEHQVYWTQIVNLLLQLMSDPAGMEGVVLVCATNYYDRIDPAILRAGRCDRHIVVQRPDVPTLGRIFRYYLGDQLAGEDTMPLALACQGATGADVQTWIRRAKATARHRKTSLTMDGILDEILDVAIQMTPEAKRRIAVHEAGHVVAAWVLGIAEVTGAAIVGSGGVTHFDSKIGASTTEAVLDDTLVFFLAGRAAETLVIGNCSAGSGGGPGSDLAMATDVAKKAETLFGFGEPMGLMSVHVDHPDSFGAFPGLIEAIRHRLDRASTRAETILAEHRTLVVQLADRLGDRGFLSGLEIVELLGPSGSMKQAA